MIHCDLCNKDFQTERSFVIHRVYGEESLKCPRCGFQRIRKEAMEIIYKYRRGARRMGTNQWSVTRTSWDCPRCGFSEQVSDISKRVTKGLFSPPKLW